MATNTDKQAIQFWDDYRKNVISSTPVLKESAAEKKKRIDLLMNNPEAAFRYYFPHYADAEPANFQKKATERLFKNKIWFEVRAWARDHAKSARAMMEVIILALKGEMRTLLIVSYNNTNAEKLLMPIKIELEDNKRIINDFGKQENIGQWEDGDFVTRDGVSFRALGSGQNPRGTRNGAHRPDFIWVDDIDDDELCRNSVRIEEAYKWLMGALFACFDIKGTKRFLMLGNIIAKDCLIKRAAKTADHFETINILDKNGIPSWKERYTLEECMYMINKLGYILSQREYYNNPIIEGTIFKNIIYRKILPLNQYVALCGYTDPSWKNNKKSDEKSTVILGKRKDGTIDVIKAYLELCSVKRMVEWHYELDEYVNDRAIVFYHMEASFMQDLLLNEFTEEGKNRKRQFPIKGDTRKKPDKEQRIESLSPLFERSFWYFNIDEQENPGMIKLTEQFKAFQRGYTGQDGGPDCCEGAYWKINHKTQTDQPIIIGRRHVNSRRV